MKDQTITRMEKIVICGKSDVGRQREKNEDSFLIGGIIENKGEIFLEVSRDSLCIDTYGLVVAVADGMGGHNAGEVASKLALNILLRNLVSLPFENVSKADIKEALNNILRSAHHVIVNTGKMKPEHANMGTTIAGIYVIKNTLYVYHAGDSRVYRVRSGILKQLTKDHSLRQLKLDSRTMTTRRFHAHHGKNIITRCLGGGNGNYNSEITDEFDFLHGDILLLCSDGLSEMVPEKEIEVILTNEKGLREKVNSLVAYANSNGGKDNITAVLIELE